MSFFSFYALDVTGVLHLDKNQIKKTYEQDYVIHHRDEIIPIVQLSSIYGMTDRKDPSFHENQTILIIQKNENKLGICVDEILSPKQIIVKELPKIYIPHLKCVTSLSMIGDHKISYTIDTSALLQTCLKF